MAFNGSGTFNRTTGTSSGTTSWADDRDAPVNITAANHDTHDQDIANGLSNCITKDGQTTITANLPMAGYIHTGVGTASARNHYGTVSQIQDGTYSWGGSAGGTANAITVTLSPAITAYTAGIKIRFIATATNTSTAVTINANSLGAKAIKKGDNKTLQLGDIVVNSQYEVTYDGTDFQLLNPASPDLDSDSGLTATGTTQGTALALTAIVNEITGSSATDDGVILPDIDLGQFIVVCNRDGSDALKVYPPSGDAINALSTNAAHSVTSNKTVMYFKVTAARWIALEGATIS